VNVSRRSRGQLRIYLGAAAGVGKTYQMLGDARLAVDEGADLVIGYLEAHGRSRTEDRARGIETAPRIVSETGGPAASEPDVEWIVERRPAIACVDESAHTNAAGAARRKLYEDVEHLLEHGIEVSTTANVQHLESLHDRVLELTGVDVRETFPDRLLHGADEIRLSAAGRGPARDGRGGGGRGTARRRELDHGSARARRDRRPLGLERPPHPRRRPARAPGGCRAARAARARRRAALRLACAHASLDDRTRAARYAGCRRPRRHGSGRQLMR
jgi:hypothetical protein